MSFDNCNEITKQEPELHSASLPIKSLPFIPGDPLLWITHLEIQFQSAKIISQRQKYLALASALPASLLPEVRDLIIQPPEANPYDALREAILKRTTVSDEKRIKQLLSEMSLGDQKPSQLLRHMQQLAGTISIDDILMRQLWLQCLPQNVQCTLSVLLDKSTLHELATSADRMMEYIPSSIAQALASIT